MFIPKLLLTSLDLIGIVVNLTAKIFYYGIKDIVNLLQVSEKTVYRWIKENKIPHYKINHQYRFNRSEINEWILSNKVEFSPSLMDGNFLHYSDNLTQLLLKGGIVPNIPGENVKEVLHNAVERINTPANLLKEDILFALLNREELMPTAIGKGIAIPHPRTPIITDINNASVSICYLETPIDFGALDGQPVHSLFILLTANPRRHLEVLSKVSYLCQNDAFLSMLKQRSNEVDVLEFVKSKETEWQKMESKN